MDPALSPEQQLLDDALRGFFARHAGLDRARDLAGAPDDELMAALPPTGYLDVVRDAGPIEGTLVAERAAAAAANAPIAARVLVAPLAGLADVPDRVGLVGPSGSLVRYAGWCDAYLVLDGDDARVASADEVAVELVDSPAGYPLGRVDVRGGERLGPDGASALRRAWQVSLAVEIGANALAAVEFSARHVSERVQFGRPMGSFQAVQHRLAQTYSAAVATIWMGRRAAWFHEDEYLTASAAAFGCRTAKDTYDNTHQVTGAIGITDEYGLTRFTTRLLALRSELGGARAHARRVARSRRLDRAAG